MNEDHHNDRITYVSTLNNTTVYQTTRVVGHREALQLAIDGGYITQPGVYAVAKPGEGRLCLLLYRVAEIPNPRLKIEGSVRQDEIK